MKPFFVMTNPQYKEGVLLRNYNGKVSIATAREYQKGGSTRHAPKFCQPETSYQKFSDRAVPMGVTLGDNLIEALEMLKKIAAHVVAAIKEEEKNDPIPF